MTGTRLEFDKVYHEANRMFHMTVNVCDGDYVT
jgi:hypothetical protein